MRLQLNSLTVSVAAGGPGFEQLTAMIINSTTRQRWVFRHGTESPVRV
ncbi:MAG TPA: hypothetical protein VK390_17015 [Propionibacteriaceae bacterium]|nr:hypothetical protein [Propionibacteriaceae bacterium]